MACLAMMFQRILRKEAKTTIVVRNPLTNQGLGDPSPEEIQAFFRYLDAKEKAFVAKSERDKFEIQRLAATQVITRVSQNKEFANEERTILSLAALQTSSCITSNLKEAQVAQLSDNVSDHPSYNLIQQDGHLRIRNLEGKHYKSSCSLSIYFSSVPRLIFPKDLDILLDRLKEGGQSINRDRYMPIIPMVFANGQVIVENEALEENFESINAVHQQVQTLCGEVDKLHEEVDIVVLAKEMKLDKTSSQVKEPTKKSVGQYKNALESGSRELDAIKVKRVKRTKILKKKNKILKLEPRHSTTFPKRDKVHATKKLCVEGANLVNKVKLRKQVLLIT